MNSLKAPLDLEAIVKEGVENFLDEYFWPCSPEIYDDLAMKNMDFMFELYDDSSGEERKLIRLVFRQLFMDFNFFACDFLDVSFGIKSGRDPICGKSSRIYKNIIENRFEEVPPSMALDEKPLIEKLKDVLRPILKRRKVLNEIKNCKDSVFFTNGLTGMIKEYCVENAISRVTVVPNYFFSKIPPFSFQLSDVENIAGKISSGWENILTSFDVKVPGTVKKYLDKISSYYFSWALRDIRSKTPFDLKGSVFFSGTGGGYWNRMISCKVQDAGGKVIRMDHGGERPFFSDRWWGINEFAFCDEFVTFTSTGADAIKANIEKEYRTLLECPEKLEVAYLQKTSFSDLNDKYGDGKAPGKINSVMFVPTGFMGEFNTVPSFTIHDVPYTVFQIQILEALKKTKLKVSYKQAPKACFDALFNPGKYGAEIVRGYLSECLHEPDSFLFTFAGTAFCEALCTNKPVILIQAPPVRPMTDTQRDDLSKVCRFVPGKIDEDNRLYVDEKILCESFFPMTEDELEERKKFRNKWLVHQQK